MASIILIVTGIYDSRWRASSRSRLSATGRTNTLYKLFWNIITIAMRRDSRDYLYRQRLKLIWQCRWKLQDIYCNFYRKLLSRWIKRRITHRDESRKPGGWKHCRILSFIRVPIGDPTLVSAVFHNWQATIVFRVHWLRQAFNLDCERADFAN